MGMTQAIKAKDWVDGGVVYVSAIDASKLSPPNNPHAGRTADGYTSIKGAPTDFMVKVNGHHRWRRVWVLQFSNASSLFVNVDGKRQYIRDASDLNKLYDNIRS